MCLFCEKYISESYALPVLFHHEDISWVGEELVESSVKYKTQQKTSRNFLSGIKLHVCIDTHQVILSLVPIAYSNNIFKKSHIYFLNY